MLQLLIRDSAFSWLHPISELIVRVDELISNASDRRRPTPSRPAMTPDQFSAEAEILLAETRELLTAGDAPGGFRERYDAVLQSDPAIVADASSGHERAAAVASHHTLASACSIQSVQTRSRGHSFVAAISCRRAVSYQVVLAAVKLHKAV
jgi:hypothetical protein